MLRGTSYDLLRYDPAMFQAVRLRAVVGLLALVLPVERGFGQVPTFVDDVGPILHQNCASCHRAGGVAPFALVSYDDARRRARQVAEVTGSRFMPPWLPHIGSPRFAGARNLTVEEIATLASWAVSEMPRGEGELEAPPPPAAGWQLGEPDLVVSMDKGFVMPAEGGEVFRNFVLPLRSGERRYVRAVEMRTDNPRALHHAILNLDLTDSSRRLDEASSLAGFDGMQAFTRALSPGGHFVSWTPGKVPFAGYEDMSWELSPSADLVLEAHLLTTGREETMHVDLGLHFADSPPARHPVILRLGSNRVSEHAIHMQRLRNQKPGSLGFRDRR